MNKFLLVLLVLFSACSSPVYIGETETEYKSKNEGKIIYSHQEADSTIYKTCSTKPEKGGIYICIYCIFKNGKCARITKTKEILEFRKL